MVIRWGASQLRANRATDAEAAAGASLPPVLLWVALASSRAPARPSNGHPVHGPLQEKNRRAQRRFRERQKAKISDLHRQIEDLTGKVGSLQVGAGGRPGRGPVTAREHGPHARRGHTFRPLGQLIH